MSRRPTAVFAAPASRSALPPARLRRPPGSVGRNFPYRCVVFNIAMLRGREIALSGAQKGWTAVKITNRYRVVGERYFTATISLLVVIALLLPRVAGADANWTARPVFDPIKDETRCMLESVKKVLNDGYQDTEILLRVDERALRVVTKSNIDAGKGDIGFQVDDHEFVPMDKVYLEQTIVFETDVAKIIEQLKKGVKAKFTLRFWPTYPDTGTKTLTFSLIGFTKAHGGLADCS